jgi:predicted alpha/beta-hydrolase family hydrolase
MEQTIFFALDDGQSFTGRLASAENEASGGAAVVVLAHGAANTMDHPLLVYLARGLARSGIACLRFNFPYSQAGRAKPDAQGILEAAWQRVLTDLRAGDRFTFRSVVAAGKSLGGRVASQMAAEGRLPVDGLIFYGYPLHPPGRKEALRDAHLDAIEVPMLFFAGTRDPFCDLALMKPVCRRLARRARLEIVDGGDHSFDLPAARAGTRDEVYRRILDHSVQWIGAIGHR